MTTPNQDELENVVDKLDGLHREVSNYCGYSYHEKTEIMKIIQSYAQHKVEERENEVSIKWDDTRDEIYTFFGTCSGCAFGSVPAGSSYCAECGSKIKKITL